jgi:uncharacterized damage-inducible protein DinB
MKTQFKTLFAYNHHINLQLAKIFQEDHEKFPEKAVKLFNHLLNAQHIWNNRIDSKESPFGVWDIHPRVELTFIEQKNHDRSLSILEEFDLDKTVQYANTKGQFFENSLQDILFHMINHSTYHRGQIALLFRDHGLEPLVSDYIFYRRNRA